MGNVVRGSSGDDAATCAAAAGPHVDDVVGVGDHVEVVFDDDDGGAVAVEAFDYSEQGADIEGVRADAGFVEDEQGVGVVAAEFCGEF